jgi:hypothetical protein
MKNIITIALVFSFIFSYAQKVTGDFNKTTDFTKYKTYYFLDWQDDTENVMTEFDEKRLRDAIETEMRERQYEKVESGGDMALSVYVVVSEKTSVSAYTNYYGGTGYRYGRYGRGWGNGYASTSYSESDYLQGTLVLDLIDILSKDLIWQGVATGTIKSSSEKRKKSIPKTVSKLMKKFPVDAVK